MNMSDYMPQDGPSPKELDTTAVDQTFTDPSQVNDDLVAEPEISNVLPLGSNIGLRGILADLDAGFGITDLDAPAGTDAINKLLPHLHRAGLDRLREALGLPPEPTSWEIISHEPESDASELKILDIEPLYKRTDPLFSDHVTLDFTDLDTTEGFQSTIGEPDDDRSILKGLFPKRGELSEYLIDKDPTRSPYDINFINEYFIEPEIPDTYQLPVVEHTWLPGNGLEDASHSAVFWDGVVRLGNSFLPLPPLTELRAVEDPVTGLIDFVNVPKVIEIEEPATEEQIVPDTADESEL